MVSTAWNAFPSLTRAPNIIAPTHLLEKFFFFDGVLYIFLLLMGALDRWLVQNKEEHK